MTVLTTNNSAIDVEEAPFELFDTGSFLQHDPIPSANPYSYTDNDPVNFTDPLGLKKKCQIEERSRIGKYEVCDTLYCPRGQCHAQSKCLSKFSKQCDSLRSKGYDRTARGWDPYYGDAWCSGCTIFSRVKSCDELCAKYPGFPDCKEKCEAKRDPKAQDNQGAGKNDGEPGKDVTVAPDGNCNSTPKVDGWDNTGSNADIAKETLIEIGKDIVCVLVETFVPLDIESLIESSPGYAALGTSLVNNRKANNADIEALSKLKKKMGARRERQAARLLEKADKLRGVAETAGRANTVFTVIQAGVAVYKCTFKNEGVLQ